MTDEDTAVVVPVLGNDNDVDGDVLTFTIASHGAKGVVSINPDGTATYTPNPDASGGDSFIYTLSDGQGGFSTATVTVTFNEVNDAPTALPDAFATDEDTVLVVAAPGVLVNDSDVDLGDSLAVTGFSATSASGAAATMNADGSFHYDPTGAAAIQALNAGQSLADTFTYAISDGRGGTSTATVTVTVAGRDEPVITPVTVEAITVNGGDAQRSNIETIAIRFSEDVNMAALIGSGAVTSAVRVFTAAGVAVTLPAGSYQYSAATRTLTIDLTVDGFGPARATLLADGRYQLRLDTTAITAAGNSARTLADYDGYASVNNSDLSIFNVHYRANAGHPLYDFIYDFDNNGRIDATDLLPMRRRIGIAL